MKTFYSIFFVLMFTNFLTCEGKKFEIIFHQSHEPSRVNVPFSDAVETEELLFLTGQIGKNHKTGELVSGGIEAETKQVIENIKDVLEYHNLSLDEVVKCTVILKNIDDFKAIT